MNKYITYLAFFWVSIFLSNCQSTTDKCSISNDHYSNTKLFKVDTVYTNVDMGNINCTVKIVKERLNENLEEYPDVSEDEWWEDGAPKLLIVYDNSNCRMIFRKKIEGMKVVLFKKESDLSKQGNLYVHLISSGGGSGFTAWTNRFILENGKLELQQLFQTGELTNIYFNQNDQEIILLRGIWEMNNENEAHFDPHKQSVSICRFGETQFIVEDIGTTKYVYSSENITSNQMLKNIVNKERNILNVNPTNFIGFNNWDGTFENK